MVSPTQKGRCTVMSLHCTWFSCCQLCFFHKRKYSLKLISQIYCPVFKITKCKHLQNQISLQRIWIYQGMLSSLCVNLSLLSHSNCIKKIERATRKQGDIMLRNRNLLSWFGKEGAHSISCSAMQCWPDSRCILVSSSLSLLPVWWWSAQQAHP